MFCASVLRACYCALSQVYAQAPEDITQPTLYLVQLEQPPAHLPGITDATAYDTRCVGHTIIVCYLVCNDTQT
jgi:hypothetical protein